MALKLTIVVAVCALVVVPMTSSAGVYTDDLTKCVVSATSKDDRLALVKWIYAAMSKHPAVSDFSKVSDSDVTESSRVTGALFMSLLTDKCLEATRNAVKYEGALAIQASFQVLGQVAMNELLSDANVGQVMAQLDQFVDNTKFESLMKEAP